MEGEGEEEEEEKEQERRATQVETRAVEFFPFFFFPSKQ